MMPGRGSLHVLAFISTGVLLGVAVAVDIPAIRLASMAVIVVVLMIAAAPIKEWVLLGWMFCAPYVQEAARASAIGTVLNNFLYLFLGVGLVLWAVAVVAGRVRTRKIRVTDFAPALLIFVSMLSLAQGDLFPTGWTRADFLRQLYGNLILPISGFYVMSWALDSRFYRRWWRTLWITSWGVSALAIVENATGFQLWGYVRWHNVDIGRAVGPLANPAVLGTFAGIVITSAAAYLIWSRGDRVTTRIAVWTILLGVPALWFTYARASILATLLAVLLIGALQSEFRFGFTLASVLAGAALVASWSVLQRSAVFTERISNVSNAQARVLLASWSLELFAMRPWTGWGYGSFDAATNRATGSIASIPTTFARTDTSHNTLLTVVVELGVWGLLLNVLAWVPPLVRGLRGAFGRGEVDWILLGAASAVFVYWVNAFLIDMRFFSLPALLAWMALGILQGHEDQAMKGVNV